MDLKELDYRQNYSNLIYKNHPYPILVDAFVALGGNYDRSGCVLKSRIIEVIEEFELTIEIEDYFYACGIEEDELSFEEFCRLFESPGQEESGT